ncbi:hypothetical protein [Flavobacterium sp.]|uniref:hypothetical protein n=1 Tax=Flavobacterium sp. TaxID=239 RepID=UPI003C4E015B
MATSKGMVSFLSLNEKENRFYGEFEIRHQGNAKEYGKIQGEKIGDTLKGRLDYISYGGSRKITPFLLLKKDKYFKLGTGLTATFMGIPYYIPETIQFKDSSFQFKPINISMARNFGLIKPNHF